MARTAGQMMNDISSLDYVGKEYKDNSQINKAISNVQLLIAYSLVKMLESEAGVTPQTPNNSPYLLSYDEECWLRAHEKIPAIKKFRERTGWGLADSKRQIEKLGVEKGFMLDTHTFKGYKQVVPFDVQQRR